MGFYLLTVELNLTWMDHESGDERNLDTMDISSYLYTLFNFYYKILYCEIVFKYV